MMQHTTWTVWTDALWKLIKDIKKDEFTLADVYSFENVLKEKYPQNNHIRDKIHQQLQIIRDNTKIEFVDNCGTYKICK
jgi:type II restriction enzyme